MPSEVRTLELRCADLIAKLRPAPSIDSTVAAPHPWDESETQQVFRAAKRQLARLRAAIQDESSSSTSNNDTKVGNYWRRRRDEYERLNKELLDAVSARKRHTQWAAKQELLNTTTSGGNNLKHGGITNSTVISSYNSFAEGGQISSAVEEAKAITSSLERTHDMMRSSLSQMATAGQVLENDGQVIESTFDQHRAIKTTTSKASRLLCKMKRQQRFDRWKLRGALCLFAVVCCFIIIRRLPGIGVARDTALLFSRLHFSPSKNHSNGDNATTIATDHSREKDNTAEDIEFINDADNRGDHHQDRAGKTSEIDVKRTTEISLHRGLDGPTLKTEESGSHEDKATPQLMEVLVDGEMIENEEYLESNSSKEDVVAAKNIEDRTKNISADDIEENLSGPSVDSIDKDEGNM